MGLVLDAEQTLLRNTATEFARARLPVARLRRLRDAADATGFDRATWREIADLGWAGMLVPEDLGGNGYGHQGLGLVLQALGRTLAATPLQSTVVLAGSVLQLAGDTPAAREWLPRIGAGDAVVAFAFEESATHAPHRCTARALPTADGWTLHGRKRFVLDGHVADRLLVLARTQGADDDANGLSLFMLDPATPGVTRRRLSMVDSRNSADVELDGVSLPASALLGTAGGAAEILDRVLDRGRILLAAEMLGMAEEAFDITLGYLKQRTQFGVPIGSFQALKHRAVQMFIEIELSRSVVFEALSALDDTNRGADVRRLASVCKARLNDTLQLVTNECVQMHGGIGVTDEFDIGLYLKRARVAQAQLGSSAVHRERYAALGGF
jgi:alkylation response protein AidB-like acyl-CoA dehydrogenase